MLYTTKSMKKEKQLSIIIPVYNVEKYIGRCLDSIYNQKVDEELFEVIVVNDGTPDNSVSIIEKYVDNHTNCTLVNQKNQGLSMARNNGFDKSVGNFVWFVDSDDWLIDKSIKTVLYYIEQNQYLVFSSNLIYAFDNPGQNFSERCLDNDLVVGSSDYILNFCLGASQRFIISRKLMLDNNLAFFPGILHEDGEFGPRLVCAAKQILVLKSPLYMYYQRGGTSIMANWSIRNTQNSLIVYQHDLNLADKYKKTKFHSAVYYEAFRVSLFAFPLPHIYTNKEIHSLYIKYRGVIRLHAIKVLVTNIPFKKKIVAFIAAISPIWANKFKDFRMELLRKKNQNKL